MNKITIFDFLDVSSKKFILNLFLISILISGNTGFTFASGVTNITANQPVNQDNTQFIKGMVIDENGVPVIGANILIKGTTKGIITDINGEFSLSNIYHKSVLVISFIGYDNKEITFGTDKNLTIKLTPNNQLDEVVVVGYGTQKKESVVGAITTVNNDALMKSGTSTVTNAIAGKLSGVLTMQQSGQPGSNNAEIIIRGVSSWNGSAPLVLVDNVERDFSDLDPNEINSISVLKDASATAVFGAKGANGVILVTTKRGNMGKPIMNATISSGVNVATQIPPFIDSYTTMSLLNVARMNGKQFEGLSSQNVLNEYKNPSTPLNSLRYPNVDWFSLLSNGYSPTTTANFNVQGGSEFVKYFCSLGWYSEGTFFKQYHNGYDDTRYNYNRFNYRSNLDFTLTKSTQLSMKVGGEVGIKQGPASSPWTNIYAVSPARYPAYFPEWVLKEVPDPSYPNATGIRQSANFGEFYGNPYSSMNTGSFNQYTDSKLFTDLILNQKLDFVLQGLSFNGKASLSTYYQNKSLTATFEFPQYQLDYTKIGVEGVNPWSIFGVTGNDVYNQPMLDINIGGLQQNYYTNLYYEVSLNYSNKFGNHNVTALALMNRQQKNADIDFPYFNEGLVGRATYDYAHKYMVEFNVGYTGSERFAPSNRFGFFPSGAVGWVVSEESFFKNSINWMNKLKLRYSDGLVGSDYAANRWLYISNYSTSGNYILEDKAANEVAQWEMAHKRDLGVEVGIFENLFTFSVDLFDEFRNKMLLTPQNVLFLVGNSFKDVNLGSMKKHGLEVEAEFNKTTSYKLSYHIKGMFGFTENRVLYKDDPLYASDYQKSAGKPVDAQLSGAILTGSGYFTSVDDIHNNSAPISIDNLNVGDYKYLDFNADGTINTNDKYPISGSKYAPITYSLSTGFNYKGFDFNMMFQGNIGKYVEFNQTYETEFLKGDYRLHTSQLDYWSPTNLTANHATLHYNESTSAPNLGWGGGESYTGYSLMIQDRFWRSADYLRLKEIYAGYTFKSNLLKSTLGISNLNIYATANNVFTITPLIEGDPERKDFYTGFYPLMSSYNIGLKIGF